MRAAAPGGYEREAGAYARARPTYPDRAVTDLCARLGIAAGDRVVELGAGTGLFTRLLVARGLSVAAVEPVPAMRGHLHRVAGVAEVSSGSAERTELPGGSADAVIAATAWHWFDAGRAIDEVRRLLRPSGALGLIWNDYDRSVPWVAELARVAERRRPAGSPRGSSGAWRAFFDDLDGWSPLRTARYANPCPTGPQGVVDRLASSSAVASLPDHERAAVRDEVRGLLRRHGLDGRERFDLPYVTTCYWTRPIRAGGRASP